MLVTIPDDYQKIIIFFAGFIQTLGEQLKLRQQVIATATVFFKRFYALNPLKSIDPLLMAPTCIFLSSKVEEFGMISTRYAQYPDPLKFSSTSLVRDPMALEPELSGIVINNLLQYKLQIFI